MVKSKNSLIRSKAYSNMKRFRIRVILKLMITCISFRILTFAHIISHHNSVTFLVTLSKAGVKNKQENVW